MEIPNAQGIFELLKKTIHASNAYDRFHDSVYEEGNELNEEQFEIQDRTIDRELAESTKLAQELLLSLDPRTQVGIILAFVHTFHDISTEEGQKKLAQLKRWLEEDELYRDYDDEDDDEDDIDNDD